VIQLSSNASCDSHRLNYGHAALGGELLHLLDGAGFGDDHLHPRCGRLAVDLVRRVEWVGRGGAQPCRTEEDEGELEAVAKQVHHHIAVPHAQHAQGRRRLPGEQLHVGVGVHNARVPVDDAGPAAHLGKPLEAVGPQGELQRDLDVGEL
jgi:hypothetical protein